MKAVLVFDVNEFTYEAIDDYFSGDITLHLGNDGFIVFKDVVLKPMPERKEVITIVTHNRENAKLEIANQNKGFNDCIDEILGEEDETTI